MTRRLTAHLSHLDLDRGDWLGLIVLSALLAAAIGIFLVSLGYFLGIPGLLVGVILIILAVRAVLSPWRR